ncbi:MAG: riboflavin synthase [Phycisphaerae bacterium]|nr:riboflavin synthase [Phycisphaerae bacterium]
MFTGIVQAVGHVGRVDRGPAGGMSLTVKAPAWTDCPSEGDSISVDGCCLTVVRALVLPDGGFGLDFDVVPQTLDLTTLGSLCVGQAVNLERAVTARTLMGGHLVQGHVDGVAEVLSVEDRGGEVRLRLGPPEEFMELIVPQGSVTLSGVSLTVAGIASDSFEVALIPTTCEQTTLGSLKAGGSLNLETDHLLKAVRHLLESRGLLKD